jgi:glyoxylase-like metal-dependent hydrolase (beta-lactamase superfamily II)
MEAQYKKLLYLCINLNYYSMNKTLKWILISLGIIVVLAVLFIGVTWFKITSATKTFAPLETGRIMDDVYVVKDDFANVFFVYDSVAGYVAIDAGMSSETVAAEMKTLGINPSEVSAVFLTHSDGDHIGALGLFDHATLYLSDQEVQMIDGTTKKMLGMSNSLPRTDYSRINDREVVRLGGLKIEGIVVPGHTAGMMAFLVNDRYLFSGDITALKDGRMEPIPSIYNMDTEQAVASMDIIRHLPTAEYIFTGHWGWGDYRKAVE